jgi:hypothetical protein
MILESNSKIYNEFNKEQLTNWFDFKMGKFLHNIDTFYYSVKLVNDFTRDTEDKYCLNLRNYFTKKIDRTGFDSCVPFVVPGCDVQLNLRPFSFAGFYNINIECPDMFDIFIADTVPEGADGESVTSEIIVQIRSYLLWQFGATKAYEYTAEVVKKICEHFNLMILEFKENRVDFCWHSNYIQNPEKFFRIDNFAKMKVSQYKRMKYEYAFKPNSEFENDYIALGRRSDKCFVRIYLKSKEVVEKGYKPWFFKEWLFNGLINRYDFYVYEKAFKKQKWKYVDMARLEFYAEFGSDQEQVKLCKAIISGEIKKNDDYIANLADSLTPRITLITNIEFQTTRRMSKSFNLRPLSNNKDKGIERRIYDYFDNRALITEYLTHSILRLVKPENDVNKSRCDYCEFWKRLRSCRMVDVKKSPNNLKLIRDYTRVMNKEVVKKRMISSAVTYSLYTKGINSDESMNDVADLLLRLNDNDIHEMRRIKDRRVLQLNKILLQDSLQNLPDKRFSVIDIETGVMI